MELEERRKTVLYVVFAGDYGLKDGDPSKQDGKTAGPHTRNRLDAAIADAYKQVGCGKAVVFAVSAGRLKEEHRMLHTVQAEHIEKVWQGDTPPAILPPPSGEEVWGTKAELEYAKGVAAALREEGHDVEVVLVNEDYVMLRTRVLTWKVGLHYDRFIPVSSAYCPPTKDERRHELKSLIGHLVLPNWASRMLAAREARRVQESHGL